MRELRVVGSVACAERLAVAARLDSLEDVLAWAHAQRPAYEIVEVLVQDEYTHDVIVRGPDPSYLVFDTT